MGPLISRAVPNLNNHHKLRFGTALLIVIHPLYPLRTGTTETTPPPAHIDGLKKMMFPIIFLPVVPHKAVAEVLNIGNL